MSEKNIPARNILLILVLFLSLAAIAAGVFFASRYLAPKEPEPEQPPEATFATVLFSEIMASNKSYPDASGAFLDWAELYNPSDEPLDISGCYLCTDELTLGWKIPAGTVIAPKGYLVIPFTGVEADDLQAPLKISKNGGELFILRDPTSSLILDTVTTVRLGADQVMVRDLAHTDIWTVFDVATPGFANTEEGRLAYEASRIGKADSLFITEIMSKNRMTLIDSYGENADWIELTNLSEAPVDLKNFCLTNDESDPFENRFPSRVLEPGQSVLLYATGRDLVTETGEIHLSFRLSENGASIHLGSVAGIRLQSVTVPALGADESYTRQDDGAFSVTAFPTPLYANTEDGYEQYIAARDADKKGLVINEVIVSNTKYLRQSGNNYYDIIELTNTSSEAVNLSEYYLSTDYGNRFLMQLPDKTLEPGKFAVVFASGDTKLSSATYAHAPFKLSAGDELYLTRSDGTTADSVHLNALTVNMSLGRVKDKGGFFYMTAPTPEKANGTGYRHITETPVPTVSQGVYDGVTMVSFELNSEDGADIYYTMNGELPTVKSKKYTSNINLSATTVIRTVAVKDGKVPSPVVTYSYIINENHTFPVISLVAEPEDLWNERYGIYADGPGYTEEFPHFGANFWNDWERNADVTLFIDGNTEFSLGCSISMFGHWGRGNPKKPFLVKFTEHTGAAKLHYQLFEDRETTEYNSFILRAFSQDQNKSKIRDELFTSLTGEGTDVLTQAYRPCVLYLNGEYWGIYFIREKINTNMLADTLGVNPESIDLLYRHGVAEEGSANDYKAVLTYITTHDMTTQEAYDYINERFDVINLFDYKIAEIYSGNYDVHNVRYYRSLEADGKWRYIYYDLDYAFLKRNDSVARILVDGFNAVPNTLMDNVLKNPTYRALFLERFALQLTTTFSDERVLSYIDNMYAMLEKEMERDNAKWGPTQARWTRYVNDLRQFVTGTNSAKARIPDLIGQLKSVMKLTDAEYETYFAPIMASRA